MFFDSLKTISYESTLRSFFSMRVPTSFRWATSFFHEGPGLFSGQQVHRGCTVLYRLFRPECTEDSKTRTAMRRIKAAVVAMPCRGIAV